MSAPPAAAAAASSFSPSLDSNMSPSSIGRIMTVKDVVGEAMQYLQYADVRSLIISLGRMTPQEVDVFYEPLCRARNVLPASPTPPTSSRPPFRPLFFRRIYGRYCDECSQPLIAAPAAGAGHSSASSPGPSSRGNVFFCRTVVFCFRCKAKFHRRRALGAALRDMAKSKASLVRLGVPWEEVPFAHGGLVVEKAAWSRIRETYRRRVCAVMREMSRTFESSLVRQFGLPLFQRVIAPVFPPERCAHRGQGRARQPSLIVRTVMSCLKAPYAQYNAAGDDVTRFVEAMDEIKAILKKYVEIATHEHFDLMNQLVSQRIQRYQIDESPLVPLYLNLAHGILFPPIPAPLPPTRRHTHGWTDTQDGNSGSKRGKRAGDKATETTVKSDVKKMLAPYMPGTSKASLQREGYISSGSSPSLAVPSPLRPSPASSPPPSPRSMP
ncbi:unnamed protein product [Vitrella brassicaformis CCMP3155]|uniref:Uncharacterized protein n=2 Tax=Vitrella brassicaformis TaxID=1169539 RepID=A0A0G4GNQ0_VITBC|nr:unnamed protein product [Vitrella brassicaformis CCMP3155]|eukprot:CEM31904.1 unnamed protein product [Vitrella brassicaformis CCMP3155]